MVKSESGGGFEGGLGSEGELGTGVEGLADMEGGKKIIEDGGAGDFSPGSIVTVAKAEAAEMDFVAGLVLKDDFGVGVEVGEDVVEDFDREVEELDPTG